VGTSELTSTGITDAAGRYTLSCGDKAGAVPGTHRIQLTTIDPGAQADERSALPEDKVPPHYQNGELTYDVPEDGADDADWNLTTRRP
jgi:hypothetical protein